MGYGDVGGGGVKEWTQNKNNIANHALYICIYIYIYTKNVYLKQGQIMDIKLFSSFSYSWILSISIFPGTFFLLFLVHFFYFYWYIFFIFPGTFFYFSWYIFFTFTGTFFYFSWYIFFTFPGTFFLLFLVHFFYFSWNIVIFKKYTFSFILYIFTFSGTNWYTLNFYFSWYIFYF